MLFVCVENAGRSQMAEGFFRKYAPREYDPLSAGIKPVSRTLAVQAMNEIGIDIDRGCGLCIRIRLILLSILLLILEQFHIEKPHNVI
jgi:protein-tyrosine-phosphatase